MKAIESEFEEILESLAGITRALASPFLYDNIRTTLQKREKSLIGKIENFITTPVIAISLVIFILLFDISAIKLELKSSPAKVETTNNSISIKNDFDEEILYNISDNDFTPSLE